MCMCSKNVCLRLETFQIGGAMVLELKSLALNNALSVWLGVTWEDAGTQNTHKYDIRTEKDL